MGVHTVGSAHDWPSLSQTHSSTDEVGVLRKCLSAGRANPIIVTLKSSVNSDIINDDRQGRAGLSYPSLGYATGEACPTLPHISRLLAVGKLSHSLLRNLLSPSPLSASGSGSLVSRPCGAVMCHMKTRRVDPRGTLGQVTLGIGPLVVVGSNIGQGCTRQMNGIFVPFWDGRARVIRGRTTSLAEDELGRGRVPGVVRGGYDAIVRTERGTHLEELVGFKGIQERRDVCDELVEVLWSGSVGRLVMGVMGMRMGMGLGIEGVGLPVKEGLE